MHFLIHKQRRLINKILPDKRWLTKQLLFAHIKNISPIISSSNMQKSSDACLYSRNFSNVGYLSCSVFFLLAGLVEEFLSIAGTDVREIVHQS